MSLERAKQSAAIAAAKLIEPNMIVGLGTGSTATYFIEALAERVRNGLVIKAVVSSSLRSEELAKRFQLPLQDMNLVSSIDITVDGADEIDSQKRMIKGGGGAHVREKILASSSKEMVVIVDETKLVPSIGTCKLPVEILRFGSSFTQKKIEALGYHGSWRKGVTEHLFVTENENFIFDVHFPTPPTHPEKDHATILGIPGVVDTGFFFHLAGRVIIGYSNGQSEIR